MSDVDTSGMYVPWEKFRRLWIREPRLRLAPAIPSAQPRLPALVCRAPRTRRVRVSRTSRGAPAGSTDTPHDLDRRRAIANAAGVVLLADVVVAELERLRTAA